MSLVDHPDERAAGVAEDGVIWWLWRISDGSLLPVATDPSGTDWPHLGSETERTLAVDALLRSNAPIREVPPANVSERLLLRNAVGWAAVIAMAVSAALALAAPLPTIINALGGFGFLLAPIAASEIVSRRRIGTLPRDLQPLAEAAVDKQVSQVGPIRWRWIAVRVIGVVGGFLLLALAFLL
jgi:hypothetical protein